MKNEVKKATKEYWPPGMYFRDSLACEGYILEELYKRTEYVMEIRTSALGGAVQEGVEDEVERV